ncbi:MAG: PD-(D/E)XK nuclease family protein [Patescibacteria group bacterium]
MSEYYTSRRTKNLYDPKSAYPFKLSRSKIELFLACPHCFYLDRRLGVGQPPGFPFSLNSAVDTLLKKEFDIHRAAQSTHPLVKYYKIDAIPFSHPEINKWRENFVGIQYHHQPTNFIISGAIDDLWINAQGELIVVDYKSTSKNEVITNIDKEWQGGYKRQMEIYQWLLRQNGHKVSSTGYFVYCNGRTDKEAFDGKLEFDITLIPYDGKDGWIEKEIFNAHKCLNDEKIPPSSASCDFCAYVDAVKEVTDEKKKTKPSKKKAGEAGQGSLIGIF